MIGSIPSWPLIASISCLQLMILETQSVGGWRSGSSFASCLIFWWILPADRSILYNWRCGLLSFCVYLALDALHLDSPLTVITGKREGHDPTSPLLLALQHKMIPGSEFISSLVTSRVNFSSFFQIIRARVWQAVSSFHSLRGFTPKEQQKTRKQERHKH